MNTPEEKQALIAQGKFCCTKCNKVKPITSFYNSKSHLYGIIDHCKTCMNTHKTKRRRQLKAQKLCIVCGQHPAQENVLLCRMCWCKDRARHAMKKYNTGPALLSIFEAQNERCAYTGVRLIPGLNASIDHKKPKSRYPNLISEIDNAQWVDSRINTMKWNMSHDEFIKICRQVVEYHDSHLQNT